MADIAPELLKKIQKEFEERFSNDKEIEKLYARIQFGTAGYQEANEFALKVGSILAEAYRNNLSAEALPDGRMYYDIAQRIIDPTMKNNYVLIAEATNQIQKSLNEAAGIGIKAVTPELNQDRIDKIIDRVSDVEQFDKISWILEEPVKNFSQSIVDDAVRVNAEFQYEAGLSPVIVRKLAGGCCDWCRALAGTYCYLDEVPEDVYRRHQRCRCTVEYDPKDGKIQNVHSKRWRNAAELDKIEARKMIGQNTADKIYYQKGSDVTSEYMKGRYPGQGKITFDDNYDKTMHENEIKVAEWLHKNLGGDINLLNESAVDGTKMPDYIWHGKYWELKSTTTEKAANSAIRKGIKQIERNPGGLILNYDTDIDLQETVNIVEKRMKGSKQGDIPIDIMIVRNGKMELVLRY